MKMFFDCEFTKLHKEGRLISIGLVAENGNTFYAEFVDLFPEELSDPWIMENVVAHLKYVDMGTIYKFWRDKDYGYKEVYADTNLRFEMASTKVQVAHELRKWLDSFNSEIELVSDVGHYDMMFFIDLFGGAFDIPYCICPAYIDVNTMIADKFGLSTREAFNYSREDLLRRLGGMLYGEQAKHNALYDARILKDIYDGLKKY